MNSDQIRNKFLKFFQERGHKVIPSASLVTPDEKGVTNSTLFNTAGMQPLIEFLLGKPHPDGQRLVDVQKCLRTVDIDDVGDKTHATFFEMLGNWSLGDYFKNEAINWSYEFLTSKNEGLGLNPSQLYITVFEGDKNAPKDDEAAQIWRKIFENNKIEGERIFYMPANSNWWEAGENGPCGPDTEMYYDVKNAFNGRGITKNEFIKADSSRELVEIWNDVFMQYEKKDGVVVGKLAKPSVDTGAGLERLCMVMQNVDNIYETDLLVDALKLVKNSSKNYTEKSARVVIDHLRAATFLIADNVIPSNTDRGYVLRKLIRRAVRHANTIKITVNLSDVAIVIQEKYRSIYPDVAKPTVLKVIQEEELKFKETLDRGLKEFEKGTDAFTLFSSYGFPLELTLELAKERGIKIDTSDFNSKFKKHQELSRVGAEQKFKGGLAGTSEIETRYHTATHLLNAALRVVLGDHVFQKGSNITKERLRFDFTHQEKMTDEQKKKVEEIVNDKIIAGLDVKFEEMPILEAKKRGAIGVFEDKYGDVVKVYSIFNSKSGEIFSQELCGGPHVSNTKEIGKFKIVKEEAVSAGVRRIKAIIS